MANDTTGRDSDKFMLRLPEGMRDRLKYAADANKRSMNAEIVARLERSLGDGDELPQFSPDILYAVAKAAAETTTTTLLEHFANFVGDGQHGSEPKQIRNLKKFIADRRASNAAAKVGESDAKNRS